MKDKTTTMEKDSGDDIIDLILADHKELKRLIKILKDSDKDIGERYAAFGEFAPLLTLHAKPEEMTLYADMKEEEEVRLEGMEGEVEHSLADQLLNEAKEEEDEDLWSAKVKVLAELLEHHIEEEEDDILPKCRKAFSKEHRIELGNEFLKLKEDVSENHPLLKGDESFTEEAYH